MASLLNLIKSRLQVGIPRVQSLVSELLPLIDRHDARQSVYLGSNPAIDNHVTKLVLRPLYGDTHELTHPRQRDPAIVALNDAQVVLDELSDHLNQVVFAVESLFLERLKSGHLLRDVIFLQWHQLESQEFSHVFRQELI